MSPKDVIKFAKKNKAVCVDFKFIDFLGMWQHITMPMSEFDEAVFEEGSASTVSRSAAGSRSTPPTCSSCPTRRPP